MGFYKNIFTVIDKESHLHVILTFIGNWPGLTKFPSYGCDVPCIIESTMVSAYQRQFENSNMVSMSTQRCLGAFSRRLYSSITKT